MRFFHQGKNLPFLMLIFRLVVVTLSCWIAITFGNNSYAQEYKPNKLKQSQYKKALKYLSKNDIRQTKKYLKKLENYPLVGYLDFHLYRKSGNNLTERQVESFIQEHEGSWLAERMRNHWLATRMSKRDYASFIRFYDEQADKSNVDMQCFLAKAYFATGRLEHAIELTKVLWLNGNSQPDLCDDAFYQLKKRKLLNESLIFQRLLLSYQTNNWNMVRYLQSKIRSAPYKIKLSNLHLVRQRPSKLVSILNTKTIDDDYRAMTTYIIKRMAKKDAAKALNLWKKIAVTLDLKKADHQTMLGVICSKKVNIEHARQCLEIASLDSEKFPAKAAEAQVEFLLTVKNWKLTQQWLAFIPTKEKQSYNAKWQYWLARSLQYTGEPVKANQLFTELMTQPNYHGFLSSIHLGKKTQFTQKVRHIDQTIVKKVANNIMVQRALELNSLNNSLHSRQEWIFAMKTLSEPELLAAAEIGMQVGWAYASISAMTTAKLWDEVHLRFPINHFKHFKKNAKHYDLNISWLLGLSRKESNFIPDIHSYAGAVGVMQVMPATAREIANKIKIPYRRGKLKDPATNIVLGSNYLAQAYKTFNNNPAYASAAYNAGIYRVKTWLDEDRRELPIDVWTDTIPISGVQDYVRSVMQFSVFYADKLGVESPLFEFGQNWFNKPSRFAWQK